MRKLIEKIKEKRAVSPVIATVILVAVAITIAVAVAYWMGGISSQYTRFEKIEVTSVYCELKSAYHDFNGSAVDAWEITLDLRNTGTTEASLIGAFVNAKAIEDYGAGSSTDWIIAVSDAYPVPWVADSELDFDAGEKITATPGSSTKVVLVIAEDAGAAYDFSSGTTVEVALHSGAGNTYMKMVTLS
jgi:flagellin-like protein